MSDNQHSPEHPVAILNLLRAVDSVLNTTQHLASRIDSLEMRIKLLEEQITPEKLAQAFLKMPILTSLETYTGGESFKEEEEDPAEEDNYDYAADDLNFDAARERGGR